VSPETATRARRLTGFAVFAALLGAAPAASAHLVTTNLGPFYDGFAHFFAAPETLLPVLALALLAGLRGPAFGRAVLLWLPVAWLAGACGSVWLAPRPALPLATAGVTLAFGALVAADVALPRLCVAGFAGGLGLFAGALAGADLATGGAPVTLAAGATCALFVTTALVAGRVTSLRAPWTRIAVRVAGSWIAASGLLMLGWALR
jgi:hydrogenase/urease accessory protein HupE